MKAAVCICTCNRPDSLGQLLRALTDIDLGELDPKSVEILIVDNNPDGNARRTCETAVHWLPLALHFVEEPERGISFARNRAVTQALARDADVIAFIDDDDLPEPDWLRQLILRQRQTGADLVFGRWSFTIGPDPPPWVKASSRFKPSEYGKKNDYGLPAWAGTGNVLIRADLLREMAARGPVFAPEFAFSGAEDKDFFIRCLRRGATYAASESSVVHRPLDPERSKIAAVLQGSFRIGCTRLSLARKYRSPSDVRTLQWKAFKNVLVTLAILPAYCFSKRLLVEQLCKASKSAGVLFSSAGGRYKHYGRT